MEIAKLVLEFLKVLVWPSVILTLVLLFRPNVERILRQFSERLGTAEMLKLGVMGQEVQISGTAKELAKERALLAQSQPSDVSPEKLQAIDRAARELNNSFADLVGLSLLQSTTPVRLENIAHRVIRVMSTRTELPKHPPMLILTLTREIEKLLTTLQTIGYVEADAGEYKLSPEGQIFFHRVADQQDELLARFYALT